MDTSIRKTPPQLRVRFFKKIQDWIDFLNPKESENGFCISLLGRSDQDFSDHGASKEPKNPLWKWIFSVPLMHHDLKDPFSDSFEFKNRVLNFLKETHPKMDTSLRRIPS